MASSDMMTPFSYIKSLVLLGLLLASLFLPASMNALAEEPTPTATDTTFSILTETLTPETPPTNTATPESTPSETPVPAESITYAQVIVKLNPQQNQEKALYQLKSFGQFHSEQILAEALGVYILNIPTTTVDETIKELSDSQDFMYAELNEEIYAQEIIPNDPGWALQYNLSAIRSPQGWDYATGSSTVIIAILDTGVDMTHPDLFGKIVAGRDFVNNDNDPNDDHGHGSHVAGLAAAYGNNGIGIAGVSWGARIMPVKVLNNNPLPSGTFANVAAGIIWATDQGAQVINLSLGGLFPSALLADAVNYAANRGVLLVAAAGNLGSPSVLYPAAYPAVIAVSATDQNNQLATFSNYGSSVELAAPGVNIYSLDKNGGFAYRNGTSMASPQVAGLAAILLGIPGNTSAALVRSQMQASALDLGTIGRDNEFGYGLIQMDKAIRLSIPNTPTISPKPLTSTATLAIGYIVPPTSASQISLTSHPTLTATSQSIVSNSITITFSATISPTKQLLPTNTSTQLAETNKMPRQRNNALLCLGSIMLILGILLLILYRKMKSLGPQIS